MSILARMLRASCYDIFMWNSLMNSYPIPRRSMNQRQLRKRAAQGGLVQHESKLKQRRI